MISTETETSSSLPAPSGKRASGTGGRKMKRRLDRLADAAFTALEEILLDGGAKAADRISAAKLALDASKQFFADPGQDSGVVRVIFDGIPEEYAE